MGGLDLSRKHAISEDRGKMCAPLWVLFQCDVSCDHHDFMLTLTTCDQIIEKNFFFRFFALYFVPGCIYFT